MRIIKGKDYYDNSLAYGQDKSIVFVRDNVEITIPQNMFYSPLAHLSLYNKDGNIISNITSFNIDGKLYFLNPQLIIVAGKGYQGLKIVCLSEAVYIWTLNDLNSFCNKIGITYKNKSLVIDYFNVINYSGEKLQYLIDNKITILVKNDDPYNRKNIWVKNPYNLNQYNFIKRLHPFQIFQEISMWIGGILPQNNNTMIELSNDMKIHKAGFDKNSFRNIKK